MYQLGIGFRGTSGPLDGNRITARGLHGLLFYVLGKADRRGADWLHEHDTPKPYTLSAYYDTQAATLAGIRLAIVEERTARLLTQTWRRAMQEGWELRLGPQTFCVADVAAVPGPGFQALATASPDEMVHLRFLSPTTFKQGPGELPLPLPANVFQRPYDVWQAFAPPTIRRIPADWPAWCAERVFVVRHQLQTADVSISKDEPLFTGFVGDVWFRAHDHSALYLSIWQGLACLAPFSGVGWKTTMGMGAVEFVDSGSW